MAREYTITLLTRPEPIFPGYIIRVTSGTRRSLLVRVVRVLTAPKVVVRHLTAWEHFSHWWKNLPLWERIRTWYRR